VNAQSLHQAGAVVLHRLGARVEDPGHLLGRVPFGDQLQDLPQARRQAIQGGGRPPSASELPGTACRATAGLR
jgi:hypothetical protein